LGSISNEAVEEANEKRSHTKQKSKKNKISKRHQKLRVQEKYWQNYCGWHRKW
jgi:hypothetical protein